MSVICFNIFFFTNYEHVQIMIWFIVPALRSATKAHTNHTVALIVLVQFIPRLFVMIPLNRKIVNSTGIAAKNAWSGAVYNMLLFILAGHVRPFFFLHLL